MPQVTFNMIHDLAVRHKAPKEEIPAFYGMRTGFLRVWFFVAVKVLFITALMSGFNFASKIEENIGLLDQLMRNDFGVETYVASTSHKKIVQVPFQPRGPEVTNGTVASANDESEKDESENNVAASDITSVGIRNTIREGTVASESTIVVNNYSSEGIESYIDKVVREYLTFAINARFILPGTGDRSDGCVQIDSNNIVTTRGTRCGGGGGGGSSGGGTLAIGGTITSATEDSILFVGPLGVLAQDNANFSYDDATDTLAVGGDFDLTGDATVTGLAGNGVRCVQTDNNGLLSVAGAACGAGGGQTPWTSAIDADGYALQDALNLEFRTAAGSAPAGTVIAVFSDNTGDLTANALTGKTFNVAVNGTDEYNFSSTALAMNSNNITGVGTAITATAGLTVTATAADLNLATATSGNITLAPASTGSVQVTSGVTTGTGTSSGLSVAANSLTTGTGLNIASSSLSSGSLLNLAVTGTAGLDNQKGINVSLSGANGTGAQTTYGGYFSNTHTGTSNNVGLYATASGGDNNYAAIFENGFVGVGTTQPISTFEVMGDVAYFGREYTDTASAPTAMDLTSSYLHLGRSEYNTDSYRLISFGYHPTTGNVQYFPAYMGYQEKAVSGYTYGDLVFGTRPDDTHTSPLERMRITFDGNVGIGDTTPTDILAVERNYAGNTNITVRNTDPNGYSLFQSYNDNGLIGEVGANGSSIGTPWGNRLSLYAYSASSGINISTQGSDPIVFLIGEAEKIRIDTDGDLGIGTTAPDKALEINSATGQNLRLTYNDSNGSATNYADLLMSSGGDLTIAPSGSDVAITGNLGITSANTTQTTTASAFALNANSLTTGTGLYAASSSLTSGSLVNLQVSGTAAIANSQTVLNVSTSGANSQDPQTTYGATFYNTHTGTGSVNVAAYFSASGGQNNYAAIFANGNVGIGTATPTARLQIGGSGAGVSTAINTYVVGGGDVLNVYDTSNGNSVAAKIWIASDSGILELADGSTADGIHLSGIGGDSSYFKNGNLGVGTDSPSRTLHVYGSDELARFGNNTSYLEVGHHFINTQNNQLSVNDELFVGSAVGIGTTAPDKALEINSATGQNLRLTYNDSNGSAANYADLLMSSGGDLTIAPSGSDVAITGNLGITSSNTTQTTTASALALNVNSLTTGTGLNIASSSLSSGALINLAVTGTAGLTNQKGINVSMSGANGTGAQTTYGGYFSNTHTGTSTNVGLYATASGGDNNYAAIFDGMVADTGLVGIGTTTPTNVLDVKGGFALHRSDGSLALDFNNTASIIYINPDQGNGPAFIANGDGMLGLFNISASSNRVGIGVSAAASYRFDVLDDTAAQTSTNRVANFSNAGATFNTTGGALSSYGGYFSSTSTRSAGANDLTNVGLYATASGAQNNYAAIFEAGFVGIETTAPNYKLQIGAGSTTIFGNTVYDQVIFDTNHPYSAWRTSGGIETYMGADNGAGYGDFGTASNHPMSIGTNSLVRMTIEAAGEIGIATSLADRQLEINSATGQNLRLTYNDADGSAANYADLLMSSGGDLTIAPSGSDVAITGNLGINAAASSTPLNVYKASSDTGYVSQFEGGQANNFNAFISTTGTGEYGIWNDAFYFQALDSLANGVRFYGDSSSTVSMQILPNGNVGIGDTTPDASLDIENTSGDLFRASSGSVLRTLMNDDGNQDWYLSNGVSEKGLVSITTPGGNPGIAIYTGATYDQDPLYIVNQGSQYAFLSKNNASDGIVLDIDYDIGIGTTAPDKRLEINSATGQNLRLTYNDADGSATNYADLLMSSGGDLTIAPSGSDVAITGNLGITSSNSTQTTTASALALNVNSLTTGTGLNIASSSLSSGALINLAVTGTAGLTNQKGINVSLSGANGTGAQTTYGGYFSNTHTGTSNNIGLYATASGGSNNYAAIFEAGNVGIGDTTPDYLLDVAGNMGVGSGAANAVIYSNSDATDYISFTHASRSIDIYSAGGRFVNFNGAASVYDINPDNANKDFRVRSGPDSYSITVAGTSGSVGVGTNVADRKLEINSATGQNLRLTYNDSNGSATNYADLLVSSSGDLTITPSGADASVTGNLATASADLGDGTAGYVITLGRNTNATNTGAGSINFQSKGGTAGYVWQDNAGNMRIHTAAPSNANDTAGTVIGTQSSVRSTKQDIQNYTDYAGALQMVADAPLHTFRYKKDVQGYGNNSPLAKDRIGYIADEVPGAFMWGNTIDQVSVNGILMASVKALNIKINNIANAPTPSGNQDEPLAMGQPLYGNVNVVLQSHLYLSGDSVGEAKILAGAKSVRVSFTKPYEYQPIVTTTPQGRVGSEYWVSDKDATGFTIYIDDESADDITFDWHSFAGQSAKLTVSNGTTQNIILGVSSNQQDSEPDVPGEVAGDSTIDEEIISENQPSENLPSADVPPTEPDVLIENDLPTNETTAPSSSSDSL